MPQNARMTWNPIAELTRRSASQPFCDGSHQGTEFAPIKMDLPAAKTVAWCACKHSQNKPFCDGSHRSL
jgi:CDGSH-type Zn-finger protein